MSKKYIGVFDSGLGGLTTVKEIIRQLPDENIVFLGDTLHMPYGNKTTEEIISYSLENVEILKQYDLKAIVIACNTSDANAKEVLKKYNEDIPIFGVINAAALQADELSVNHRIGIIATKSTVDSGKYVEALHSLNKKNRVYPIACPKLVPMIEKGMFLSDPKQMKETLAEYLEPLKEKDIDTLILGCTHYDILWNLSKEIMPGLMIVSSSRCVVAELKRYLKENDLLSKNKKAQRIYMVTSDPEDFEKTAALLIDDIEIKRIA